MAEQKDPRFVVYCEAEDREQPLFMTDLSFARLIDDVVVPFRKGESFWVDGVAVTKKEVRRLKILLQGEGFGMVWGGLHHGLRWGDQGRQRMYADQYPVRVEACLRETTEDVTSQVVKAYEARIEPSLRDYLPKREELIAAACQVFVEGIRLLGGGAAG